MDYVWKNFQEEVRASLTTSPRNQVLDELAQYKRRFALLDKVSQAQSKHLRDESPQEVFNCLLDGLLELTNSEFDFIGNVHDKEDGGMYLRSLAITNIAWNEATREFYDANIKDGLVFDRIDSLHGYCLTRQVPVMSNDTKSDPRASGSYS